MIETNIGQRVKALREAAGMSQEALAVVLGIESRQSVSELERGKRKLNADELVTLVEKFDVTFEQLTNPFLLSAKDSFSWRQRDVPEDDLNRFEARAGEWIGAYHELSRLNATPLRNLMPRLGMTHDSSFEEAVEAGERVFAELELGERPALALADALQDKLGILVLMVNAIDGVSGAACRLHSLNAILINRHESAARRNSDLAHEVFHLLTWDQMKPERVESADDAWSTEENGRRAPNRAPTRSEKRNQRIENLADNFASGLLIPSAELDRIGEPHGDLVEWLTDAAIELGISARGLKWRLVNSGRHPEIAKVANVDLDYAARARGEAVPPPPFSKRFVRTLIKAMEGGHISTSRAARLTDLSRSDLAELCKVYGLEPPVEL